MLHAALAGAGGIRLLPLGSSRGWLPFKAVLFVASSVGKTPGEEAGRAGGWLHHAGRFPLTAQKLQKP